MAATIKAVMTIFCRIVPATRPRAGMFKAIIPRTTKMAKGAIQPVAFLPMGNRRAIRLLRQKPATRDAIMPTRKSDGVRRKNEAMVHRTKTIQLISFSLTRVSFSNKSAIWRYFIMLKH